MKSNEIWTIVGIAALTSVVVFFVLYFAFGQVMFAPYINAWPTTNAQVGGEGGGTSEINANRCQADGTCEMNNADIGGAVYLGNDPNQVKISHGPDYDLSISAGFTRLLGNFNVRDNLQIGDSVGSFPENSSGNVAIEKAVSIGGSLGVGEGVEVGGYLKLMDPNGIGAEVYIDPRVEYPIRMYGFMGNGTGYACINEQGALYKSTTPCI
ncbi:MAG: hypothetical protein KKD18_04600 [Nanoarchaeota archaeon]|nr:hypothetical protein [Nanoarchaeota archaeon]MBU0977670.1 hypothetical protein [Nanoarchaeota archaeon]